MNTRVLWSGVLILGVLGMGVFGLGQNLLATEQLLSFESPEQRQFFEELTHEFRCLKCQNQTIADSKADLAEDLRQEIYAMVVAGKDRTDITNYLVERYGDFVLYRPRMQATTYLLWFGPPLLLIIALFVAWQLSRNRSRKSVTDSSVESGLVSKADIEKARSLLNK